MYVNVTSAGIHLAETDVFTEFEVRTPLSAAELEAALSAAGQEAAVQEAAVQEAAAQEAGAGAGVRAGDADAGSDRIGDANSNLDNNRSNPDGWGYFKDGHVWVSRDRIIAEAQPLHAHAVRWREQFDGMIDYAKVNGWLDESGQFVRAHVEYL